MATIAECFKIDAEQVAQTLQKAGEQIAAAEGEVVLDFSGVRRVDAGVLRRMEELAALADQRGVKVGLRGVHVDVYKVFKLVKLSSRFTFLG